MAFNRSATRPPFFSSGKRGLAETIRAVGGFAARPSPFGNMGVWLVVRLATGPTVAADARVTYVLFVATAARGSAALRSTGPRLCATVFGHFVRVTQFARGEFGGCRRWTIFHKPGFPLQDLYPLLCYTYAIKHVPDPRGWPYFKIYPIILNIFPPSEHGHLSDTSYTNVNKSLASVWSVKNVLYTYNSQSNTLVLLSH